MIVIIPTKKGLYTLLSNALVRKLLRSRIIDLVILSRKLTIIKAFAIGTITKSVARTRLCMNAVRDGVITAEVVNILLWRA